MEVKFVNNLIRLLLHLIESINQLNKDVTKYHLE